MRLMTSQQTLAQHGGSGSEGCDTAGAVMASSLHVWAQGYLQRLVHTSRVQAHHSSGKSAAVVVRRNDMTSDLSMRPTSAKREDKGGSEAAAVQQTMRVHDTLHERRQRHRNAIADALGCRALRVSSTTVSRNVSRNSTTKRGDDDDDAALLRASQRQARTAADDDVPSALRPSTSAWLHRSTPPITHAEHNQAAGDTSATSAAAAHVSPSSAVAVAPPAAAAAMARYKPHWRQLQERQVRRLTAHLTHLLQTHTAALGLQGSTAVYGQVTLLGNAMLMTVLRHAVLLQTTAAHHDTSNNSHDGDDDGMAMRAVAAARTDKRRAKKDGNDAGDADTTPEVSARAVLAVLQSDTGACEAASGTTTTTTMGGDAIVRVVLQLLSQPCCQGQLRRVLWGALTTRHRHLLRRLHEGLRAEAGLSLLPSPSRTSTTTRAEASSVPGPPQPTAVCEEAAVVDAFLRARCGLSAAELEADLFQLPGTLFSATPTASSLTPCDSTGSSNGRGSGKSSNNNDTLHNRRDEAGQHDGLRAARRARVAVRPMDDGAHFVFTTRSAALVRALGRPRTDRFVAAVRPPVDQANSNSGGSGIDAAAAASSSVSSQQRGRRRQRGRNMRHVVARTAHTSPPSFPAAVSSTAAAAPPSPAPSVLATSHADAAAPVLSATCVDELWRLMAEMTQLRIALSYMLQLEHLLHECKTLWQCHAEPDERMTRQARQGSKDVGAADTTRCGRADRPGSARLDGGTLQVQSVECVLRALALVLAPCASLLRREMHATRFLRKYRLRARTTPDDYRDAVAALAPATRYPAVHALYKAFVRAVRGDVDGGGGGEDGDEAATARGTARSARTLQAANTSAPTRHDGHDSAGRGDGHAMGAREDAFLQRVMQTIPACAAASPRTPPAAAAAASATAAMSAPRIASPSSPTSSDRPTTATDLTPGLLFACHALPAHTAPPAHHAGLSHTTTRAGAASVAAPACAVVAEGTTATPAETTTCVLRCCRPACTVPWPFELVAHRTTDATPASGASICHVAATASVSQPLLPCMSCGDVRFTLPRWLLALTTRTTAAATTHMSEASVTASVYATQQQQQHVRRLWHVLSAAQRAELRRCGTMLRRHSCLLSVNGMPAAEQAAVRRVMQNALQLLLRLR